MRFSPSSFNRPSTNSTVAIRTSAILNNTSTTGSPSRGQHEWVILGAGFGARSNGPTRSVWPARVRSPAQRDVSRNGAGRRRRGLPTAPEPGATRLRAPLVEVVVREVVARAEGAL